MTNQSHYWHVSITDHEDWKQLTLWNSDSFPVSAMFINPKMHLTHKLLPVLYTDKYSTSNVRPRQGSRMV